MNSRVFNKNTIEFITVCKEFVAFCEDHSPYDPLKTVTILQRLLPLIYLKASLLPTFELQENFLEEAVSEDIYNLIAHSFEEKFGEMDLEGEIFETTQTNNEKNTAPLSEIITDIYQDLKNLINNYQSADENIMESALYICKQNFELFWGQRLLTAIQILHTLLYLKGEWWHDLKSQKHLSIDEIDTSQWIINQRRRNSSTK